MYVCMYVCMYVYIYIYISLSLSLSLSLYIYIYIYSHCASPKAACQWERSTRADVNTCDGSRLIFLRLGCICDKLSNKQLRCIFDEQVVAHLFFTIDSSLCGF